MQLKTILNRVQKFKSFVYAKALWSGSDDAPVLEIEGKRLLTPPCASV
jgi:hypothetical protein